MKIQILVDIKDSFFIQYLSILKLRIKKLKHKVKILKSHKKIEKGDILFLISCKTILKNNYLKKNKKNIVIHPSKLPLGKGSGAVAWNILSGKKDLYVSLFEATNKLDSGDIYIQKKVTLNGYELNHEIRKKQANLTINSIMLFLKNYKKIKPFKQSGKTSFFRKRNKSDSEININKSIKNQFNLLRVVDNDRYPAFFKNKKKTYILKIYSQNEKN